VKKQEREDMTEFIHKCKLDIKHAKEDARRSKATEQDLFRENKKVQK
jgi:hypothetical protein